MNTGNQISHNLLEKRKVYVRIMREARERTEHERSKENKKREKQGLPPLPEDTFEMDYILTVKKIFEDIEERKNHVYRMEQSQKAQRVACLQGLILSEQCSKF